MGEFTYAQGNVSTERCSHSAQVTQWQSQVSNPCSYSLCYFTLRKIQTTLGRGEAVEDPKLGGEWGTQPVTCEAVRAAATMWLQPKDSNSNQDSSYSPTGLKKQQLNFSQGAERKRRTDKGRDKGRGSVSTF